MRRLLSYILLLCCLMPLMAQRTQISLPNNGEWPEFIDDSIMLIGPTQETLSEKQLYFNPVYLITHPSKEHLKAKLIRACACDCDTSVPNRRIGVFSVSGDKKVSFSQGNLQYLPAANIWRFADNQYDYCGNANKFISATFRNWVDLFGWSADDEGAFVDWGTNAICGDEPGTWRALSKDEWKYLLHSRENASAYISYAYVNGTKGLVILPDNWLMPEGLSFSSFQDKGIEWKDPSYLCDVEDYTGNDYTAEEWQLMEANGAVLLPANGFIKASLQQVNEVGRYWSSTAHPTVTAYYFSFGKNFVHTQGAHNKDDAHAVRLVHDTVVPEYVDLGLSVKWATFNVGATAPEECGYYFAWGEIQPKDNYTTNTYKWCEGSYTSLTKYCTNTHYGTLDNDATLDPEDDAATVHWKGDWRTPTKEEWIELQKKCTWTKITINGVTGMKVTSKVAGYTDKSIFLPAGGVASSKTISGKNTTGYYQSSSLNTGDPVYIGRMYFKTGVSLSLQVRYYGNSVRPVYGAPALAMPSVTTTAATQITSHSALVGGKITSDASGVVLEHGIVYSTTQKPTIENDKIVSDQGMGLYYLTLNNLDNNTTYYARAYAINEQGVGYGEQVTFTTSDYQYEDTTGYIDGHAYVDLGLSVKWATCNLGAAAPEEHGDYFAWGETEPKTTYNWSTYKWSNPSATQFYKYVVDSSYGEVDNKTTLEAVDDAATANWGDNWRMPTYHEILELYKNCITVWTTVNGVTGHRFTSKINGNSIFIPAAGYKSGSTISWRGSFTYLACSSLYTLSPRTVYCLKYFTSYETISTIERHHGCVVRPVSSNETQLGTKPIAYSTKVVQVTEDAAWVESVISSDGGNAITEYGVVYGTSKNPTTADNKVVSQGGYSSYICHLTDLSPETTYYVRAFATNSVGTTYSAQQSFTTINLSLSEPEDFASEQGFVDLGLSVKWATCNIGATTPTDAGYYFAWGETQTKANYSLDTYLWYDYSTSALTKYCLHQTSGAVDNLVTLDAADDAATAIWVNNWRMPTQSEWQELREQCTWYWRCINGRNGYKIVGPNGNSIFLPAAGYQMDKTVTEVDTKGHYWSNEINREFSMYAQSLFFSDASTSTYYDGRYIGLSVRAVISDNR